MENKANIKKVIDNLKNVKNNCEYIIEDISVYNEEDFEDNCLCATSLIDTLIYRLKETKDELRKEIK